MHLGKPKNIMILILLIANLMLAGIFFWRVLDGARTRAETDGQIIELLAGYGVRVAGLPDSQLRAAAMAVPRSHAEEQAAVLYLIGETEAVDAGGGIMDYNGDSGTAQFQAGGRYTIKSLTQTGDTSDKLYDDDAFLSQAARALADMGLKNTTHGAVTQDHTATFGQTVNGLEVFNARTEVSYTEGGRLAQADGVWCFGAPQPDSEPCRSAGSVLLEYAASLDGQRLDILDIQLGYRLRPMPPDAARLTPEWRLICAGRDIYLDAYTAKPSVE